MKYLRSLSSHVYRFISVHGADGREAGLHGGRKIASDGAECQEFGLAKNAVTLLSTEWRLTLSCSRKQANQPRDPCFEKGLLHSSVLFR